jgi:hypothetical protein
VTVARRRRRLGFGLIAFGATGLVLSVLAGVLVLASLGGIGDAATSFERQRTELLSMVEPAASALSNAADSASNAGGSLTAASDASRRAAALSARLATSFEGLAGLGALDIFGTHPFAGVTAGFTEVATESRALAVDLNSTADSLATNVADSQSVATDLRTLADRLRQLGTTIRPASGRGAGVSIAAAEIVVLGLLAWLAAPAVVCLWIGSRLARNRPIGIAL